MDPNIWERTLVGYGNPTSGMHPKMWVRTLVGDGTTPLSPPPTSEWAHRGRGGALNIWMGTVNFGADLNIWMRTPTFGSGARGFLVRAVLCSDWPTFVSIKLLSQLKNG